MKLIESLTHQPVELAFGTSGLRGLVKDMTDLECYINTAGFLTFLATESDLKPGEKVYVAGDLRTSTPHIVQVVATAIGDAGYQPVYCGKIPTPALAYYALAQQGPCIMVTGSHIPADRNGIKFYKRGAEVLKADEAPIQAAVKQVREQIYQGEAAASLFDDKGALRRLADLPAVEPAAEEQYKRRYLDILPADSLKGATLVVYQQSAVARDMYVEIFQALGAEVIAIERSDEFIPIDTDKITTEEKARFAGFAKQYPQAFAIISADGDSDRPIVIDEHGEFRWGDLLGAIVAESLGIRFAATVVTANDAVDILCKQQGIALAKTKIGSPYVISAMSTAPTDQRPSAAWELNGGFLLGDNISYGTGTLSALPTRDALLPILVCLLTARQKELSISALFNQLPKRYAAAEMVEGVPEDQIARFRQQSADKDVMTDVVAKLFADSDMGAIQDVNVLDGLRVRFASGDVIHFRPSGNAPQFRVYTNAGSQARADELVAKSFAQGGYLEQLLTHFA